MKGKQVAASLIALILTASLAFADTGSFKPGTQPKGFRDLKWGQRIDVMETMRESRKDRGGLVTVYERSSDKLLIGSVPLEAIEYHAFEGRLCGVLLWFKSESGFERLREILFVRFGEVIRGNIVEGAFAWMGPHVRVLLEYNSTLDAGIFGMKYNPIADEINRQEQELIREEAKDF